MKNDIILAGVGGQGILSIAAVIGFGAVENNLFIKQAEVHGMSQRGGDVQSHMRLSDSEISSDLIPYGGADLILSVEPMESLRYLPWLSPNGHLVTSSNPYNNISDYPDPEDIYSEIRKIRNHLIIDAEAIARDIGSARAANIVMLGAASPYINVPYSSLENAIRKLFGRKGEEVIDLNLRALKAGAGQVI
ncbi:MAG: indolepyruvate oxidoreductase subunit beta [Marinilabiliaceae bacterium]|jgi:indolepyruvate ferredoxin oxidoreductase beta subunit|nr:indolepyruvate oxidoreductase subunit beta [Marinilabiliaceae bacterium]